MTPSKTTVQLLALLALTLLAAQPISALEQPSGVLGVYDPEQSGADADQSDGLSPEHGYGGAAVLIDADGRALTLREVVPEHRDRATVILPGGMQREAEVLRRGERSGAVLLQVALRAGDRVAPLALADSRRLRIGDTVWTAGNPFGALEKDGVPSLSRGIVSGRYRIAGGPIRGRRGEVLSRYRGAVIETDAAVNDGNQGGALLDDRGRLVGICSLGVARERRLGTAVPVHLLLDELDISLDTPPPAPQRDPVLLALREHAAASADGLALVYLQRPHGPGNPSGMPRPAPITDDLPGYERERLHELWARYYHQQQIFYSDQAVTALVIDAEEGLLLTALSNLHGNARRGMVLLPAAEGGDGSIRCQLHASDQDLDLALLKCERPLPLQELRLATEPDLHTGDPVAVLGRHRDGGRYTMTIGVISATQRRARGNPHPLHQTDALSNYGSLGGPVLDLSGDVVGMIVRMHPSAPWGINSGVALFLDSASIRGALEHLRAGENRGGRWGLGIHYEGEHPIRIVGVLPESGAAAAGLLPGDQLLSIDEQPVGSSDELRAVIGSHDVGDEVAVGILRDGERMSLPVTLQHFGVGP